jgi:multidrug efflux pump subunit AcrA (membrane-fusion protein)
MEIRQLPRIVTILCCTVLASCSGPEPVGRADAPIQVAEAPDTRQTRPRTVRLTGTLEAVRSTRLVVPQLTGPTPRMTLTRLVANGSEVSAGDVVAEFDPLEQLDQARQSAGNYESLSFQVRQRQADNVANAEQRRSELEQAEADLEKAMLEVSKAPVLSGTEARQNEIRAEKARQRVESLKITQPDQEAADRAVLRALELQRDRQRATFERAEANLERLRVRAPLAGMVAHATRYNNGQMIRPQEGDQMNRNNALMSIFDPGEMLVRVSVPEPDGALLHPGLEATVFVDAYPEMSLRAHLVSASPVAAAPLLGTGVKSFKAVFRLDEADPRLMPDLSAAVVFEAHQAPGASAIADARTPAPPPGPAGSDPLPEEAR